MFRNDDPTAISAPPAVLPVTASGPGYFTNGNPVTGVAGTLVPDWFLNQLQEELIGIVLAAGIAPQKGNNSQVLSALQTLFKIPVTTPPAGSQAYPSGWQTLGSGIIVQWGNPGTLTGDQDVVIFPVTFPNNIFAIIVNEANAIGWGNPPQPTVYGSTRTANNGFLLSAANISTSGIPSYAGGTSYNYLAIGN